MDGILCEVDDKQIPLYRVMWVSELPHFCGDSECDREGQYEIRLEQGESVSVSYTHLTLPTICSV